MLDWDDLRFVLLIARHGSLTAAGRAMGVSQPTMGRRLDSLEARLGVALFERLPGGVALNPLGTSLLEPAERMEENALRAERRIAARDPALAGFVRVTTLEYVGHHILAPILARFCRAHPAITVELLTADRTFSLTRHEADIAIRVMPFEQDALVQRKLPGARRALYASPDYLTQRGKPDFAAGCPGHALITMPEETFAIPEVHWLHDHLAPGAHIALRSNSLDVQAAAAVAGAGLVVLPCALGDGLPGLRRVETPEPPMDRVLWLGYHEDLRHTPRVRALADHIVAELT